MQYGFIKERSTTGALLSLESFICKVFANNHHQVSFFIFFIWRMACHGILLSLYESGLSGHLPLSIRQFLCHRPIRVWVGGVLSEDSRLEDGVSQGSILCVTLFAMAINGVIGVLPDDVQSSLYVDDLFITFSVAPMSLVERKLLSLVSDFQPQRLKPCTFVDLTVFILC